MSSRAQPSVVLRFALIGVAVLGAAWLALREPQTSAALALPDEIDPLPAAAPACRLRGEEALAHARALEQGAAARWERTPFALREAPRAVVQMAEAESCYAAANEREARMRTAAKRRTYEVEVQRRFARARLLLRAAGLAPSEPSQSAQQEERARVQVATLLALLDRAPASAEPYRLELTRLERQLAAQAAERSRTSKKENP